MENKDNQYPFAMLLRYSDYHGIKTIKEHQQVIEDNGYCWFGKIGKKPSPKFVAQIMDVPAEYRRTYLYTSNKLHKCLLLDVSYETPKEGFPEYYRQELFTDPELKPVIYFKLTDIEECPLTELDDYVVVSSGKDIVHDLKNSISSFYIIQEKDGWVKPPKKEYKKKVKPVMPANISGTCMFQKNGICRNSRSVNYGYDCERPTSCARFKPSS